MIVPIPKSSPPDVKKLRYIILFLPVPSKILESLIFKKLRKQFEMAIWPDEHEFRRNASTTTALLKIVHTATKIYDDSSKFGAAKFGDGDIYLCLCQPPTSPRGYVQAPCTCVRFSLAKPASRPVSDGPSDWSVARERWSLHYK